MCKKYKNIDENNVGDCTKCVNSCRHVEWIRIYNSATPPVHGARPTLRIPCGRGLTPPAVMDSTPLVLAVRMCIWIILILLPDILYSAHSGEVSLVLHGPPRPPAPPAYSIHRRSPFMLCKPELPCYMEHPYSCVCVCIYVRVCVCMCVCTCLTILVGTSTCVEPSLWGHFILWGPKLGPHYFDH